MAGRCIRLTKSTKNPPDKILLQHLHEEELARQERARKPAVQEAPVLQKSFAVAGLCCGVWDFDAADAVFTSHLEIRRKGIIAFRRTHLAVKLESPGWVTPTEHVELDYASMTGPIFLAGGAAPHLTITATVAPKFFQTGSLSSLEELMTGTKSVKKRVTKLGHDEHGVTATAFIYRIMLQHQTDLQPINALKRERQIPTFSHHPTRTMQPRILYLGQLASFHSLLAAQPWPYQVKYQAQMLVDNGILPPGKASELFPAIRQLVGQAGADHAPKVLRKFAKDLEYCGPGTDADAFTTTALTDQMFKANETLGTGVYQRRGSRGNANMLLIHRVMVTPVGIYLDGPYPESMNRVLRQYRAHADKFLRVEFCEETGDSMTFDRNASLEEVFWRRFQGVLRDGIRIGDQHFEFLGFSHSSLRAHLCWFVAPFTSERGEDINAISIIPLLGDFTRIRSPAKYAARIGQTLSETHTSIAIDLRRVSVVKDIKTNVRGHERIFSDGVGTLSMAFWDRLCDEYAVRALVKPTVFQVRVAGAKGMISLDSTMVGDDLRVRRSMIKFDAVGSWNVEICGSGLRPLPCFLNRQFIKILEDLGVPQQNFMHLQQDEIDRLRKASSTPLAAAAFLERLNLPSSIRLPWLLRELHRLGGHFSDDDFLRRAVELAFLVRLRDLKYRSRILVEQGWTLYGIMDETGVLQEDEIYCPVITEAGRREVLVQNNVVITRAPALHPGDVQMVHAVDVPAGSPLEWLHNCVVFSQHGVRDLPSKLSGGDLDGDLYHVIYDARLRPARLYEPAEYPRTQESLLDRPVQKADIIDFFLTFMQQDQLGRIAILHQAIADHKDEGTSHPDCLTLAELHSTAVDFSKSGRPADITRIPKYQNLRPDFMSPSPRVHVAEDISLLELDRPGEEEEDGDGPRIRYYKSEKTLGHLYRAIDERDFLEDLKTSMQASERKGGHVVRQLWAHVQRETAGFQWRHHVEMAKEVKALYEDTVVDLMYQYAARPSTAALTEVEVFIGHVVGKEQQRMGKRQREASKKYDSLVSSIMAEIANEDSQREESLERSVACLSLWQDERTVRPKMASRKDRDILYSFRWIAATVCLQELQRFRREMASG
ncbi:MAG: hypothetical protein M1838_005811 [Thelocarpon superellum]|nr:MAG: hypothetical protein M1838_005811 [Thelocarpon superellum]